MFQRLLVAIDGTEGSEVALSLAVALTTGTSSAVHALHVNEYVVGGRGTPLRTDDEATQLIVDAVGQLRSEGVRATGSVRRASYRRVADQIVTMADAFSADAILLGTHRRGRWGTLFSRGVREKTVRLTALSVIAAPAPLDVPSNGRFDLAAIVGTQPASEQAPSALFGRRAIQS